MARFNRPSAQTSRTVNLAGGEAFIESPKLELVTHVLNSFVQDQYYRTGQEGLAELRKVCDAIKDKEFLAQLAVFARQHYGMRSISHVLACEVAASIEAKGTFWLRPFFYHVIRRVDDITEILSYWKAEKGGPYPNAMKRGLADAFSKFNGYQLAKYRSEGKGIGLRDAANYLHPRPVDRNRDALKGLIDGSLVSEDTWETMMTRAGQEGTEKGGVWRSLLREEKMPYFALLRNLRNIIRDAPDVETVGLACAVLTNEKMLRQSLVLPFRFIAAYEAVHDVAVSGRESVVAQKRLLDAIADAIDLSLGNLPELPGDTCIVFDCSASMGDGFTSNKGKATLFAAAVAKKNPSSDVMAFGTDARYLVADTSASIMNLVTRQLSGNHGVDHGTNFHAIFEAADKRSVAYDRFVIFSDMQGWVGYENPTATFNAYCQSVGKRPKVFCIDLAGYGTMMFPERDVYTLAGWSEKIFDLLLALEQDRAAQISMIERVDVRRGTVPGMSPNRDEA